jgi:RNA polymerase sigma-70 factor (sigma-E family)
LNREVAEVSSGRKETLSDFYSAYAPSAVGLGYLLTGDHELAQDLVQEAFVRILSRFRHIRGPDLFGAYLRKTVVNLAKNYVRRSNAELRLTNLVAGEGRSPSTSHVEERDELWRALHRLPLRQRTAIVLRYYEGLPQAEAASILRCSTRALNSLVSRGMSSLRAELEERYG